MSVLFHESERKAKAGKGYFENVSTQVDIENAGGPIVRHKALTARNLRRSYLQKR